MEYLIRFAQVHESFRKVEVEALASLADVQITFSLYQQDCPYAIIRASNEDRIRSVISRSISSKAIYELWGVGNTYEELHQDVKNRTSQHWSKYRTDSFRFLFDTFQGSLSLTDQGRIVLSFSYLGFEGPIRLKKGAQQTFTVFEEHEHFGNDVSRLKRIYLGRWIGSSQRHILDKYTLKKRPYINTTSMDAELAFLTANITLARPNTIFYDPFVGTGSFSVACAHFGAFIWGSDIDGRMVRGKEGKNICTNLKTYGLLDKHLDGVIADLTHSPFRLESGREDGVQRAGAGQRYLDGIICDPPYGVREGLKVLGCKDDFFDNVIQTTTVAGSNGDSNGTPQKKKQPLIIDGVPAHLREGYIPPKRAYSLEAMLQDILSFAAHTLVDGGRCSLWMPTANDEIKPTGEAAASLATIPVPEHRAMELVSVCVQEFNRWSRRLLTYQRIPGVDAYGEGDGDEEEEGLRTKDRKGEGDGRTGRTADDLNNFRKRYFQGFRNKQVE